MSDGNDEGIAKTIKTTTIARRVVVFSLGTANPGTSPIHVLSPDQMVQIAPLLKAFRATVVVENASTNCETKAVFQATDDGITWGNSVGLEANFVAGNRTTTTDWYSDTANFKRGIQIGVLVQQSSVITTLEVCKVTMIVDLEFKH